jgi:hypothetical protein
VEKMKRVLIYVSLIICLIVSPVFAETVSTNWWSNNSSNNNVGDSGGHNPPWPGDETVRLANAYDGYIEGTVPLPYYGTWDINFHVQTDGNFQSTQDYVKIKINGVQIAEFNNYPISTFYQISHTIEGDSFTYHFELHSTNYAYHAHMMVGNGTASSMVETFSCVGFESPMDKGPVTAKKNRALPLKAQLFRDDGSLVTDADITAKPMLQVWCDPGTGADPIDVTDQALSVGKGTEGNEFVFTEEEKWQLNLKTNNYTANGTYLIYISTGDPSGYLIDSGCVAIFVIK